MSAILNQHLFELADQGLEFFKAGKPHTATEVFQEATRICAQIAAQGGTLDSSDLGHEDAFADQGPVIRGDDEALEFADADELVSSTARKFDG